MTKNIVFSLVVIVVLSTMTLSQNKLKPMSFKPSVVKQPFGEMLDGKKIDLYTLTNTQGMKASIMTYGGILVSLYVPDRSGKFDDVVLGFDSLSD